jgi:hypothetical protein
VCGVCFSNPVVSITLVTVVTVVTPRLLTWRILVVGISYATSTGLVGITIVAISIARGLTNAVWIIWTRNACSIVMGISARRPHYSGNSEDDQEQDSKTDKKLSHVSPVVELVTLLIGVTVATNRYALDVLEPRNVRIRLSTVDT